MNTLSDTVESRRASPLARLLPAGAALLTALLLLAVLDLCARHETRRNVWRLAALNLPENTRGVALQKSVFSRRHCLPIYGSSEMGIVQPTRADLFFHDRSEGFRAVVVGQPGDRCLLLLQELAALGEAVRGRKVAVFLSPVWFQSTSKPSPDSHYEHGRLAANFSALQLGRTLADGTLSLATRHAVATRMLDYREIVRGRSPLLGLVTASLGGVRPVWLGRAGFLVLRPLLCLQNAVLAFQDRYHQLELLHTRRPVPEGHPFGLRHKFAGWDSLLAEISRSQEKLFPVATLDFKPRRARKASADTLADPDADFRRRMAASTEWEDLELLLTTLHQLKARPLLISQPFNGAGNDQQGVSAESRRTCCARIAEVAARYHVPLRDFSDHEEDRAFFRDVVHPSARAWVLYDEVLADFYTGKHHE